jgi:hypothetical protein
MKTIFINKFENDGLFIIKNTFYNKDKELCLEGHFKNKRKKYTFIYNDKKDIIVS